MLFVCVFLAHGTFVTSTNLTNVAGTNSWYISIFTLNGMPGNFITYDVDYTKGDESNVAVTFAFTHTTAVPVAGTLAYLPETSSAGVVTTLTRYMSATGHYALCVDIPDTAKYVTVTFTNTGGTPTGTIVANGYVNLYR